MKINKLFFASLAILATLVGCNKDKEEPSVTPSLSLDKTEVELGKEGGSATITLTTNRDWTATPSAEWIAVEPESGSASDDAQSVTITVLPNTGNNRTASVSFSIGLAKKSVSVSQLGEGGAVQEGEGTKESPYTVAKALEIVTALGADQQTETAIYVKGIICSMKDGNADAIKNFGNASYYISDDGTDTKDGRIMIFQSFYLGNVKFTSEDQIKVGDEVVVYGKFTNYMGNTPETVGKGSSYIYSLNGEVSEGGNVEIGDQKGSGTEADPFNPAAAIAKCIEVGQTESTEEYYVKGIVSRITEISATYKNAKFYISEDGSTTGEFYVYACSYLGGEAFVSEDQLKVGDEVVVKGKLVNYYGNTPEMTKGCYLVSINGGSTGGDYISVSFKTKTVASEAGSFTFDVTSNQDWTVSSDNTFATVSPTSGSGNGTVTVTYTKNEGETRTANITVKAASGEEKIVLTQYDKDTTPAVTLTWSANDWKKVSDTVIELEKDGYKITIDKKNGSTAPDTGIKSDGSIRTYAKASITIEGASAMQSIVFALSDKYRTPEITADSGSVATQSASDDVVSWTGNTNKVSFTVGDKAVYGSDGADKAGQLRFKSITIQQ